MPFVSPWPAIGDALDATYQNRLFYHQDWSESHNFLELLVPPTEDADKFFGTHVLNIFLAQKFYGWKPCIGGSGNQYRFDWPPDGFNDTLARFNSCSDRFASYKTLIWVDKWSAAMMQAENPATEWLSMMEQTRQSIENFCSANSPWFVYMGTIDTQVEPPFFYPYIDEFYGSQPYYQ